NSVSLITGGGDDETIVRGLSATDPIDVQSGADTDRLEVFTGGPSTVTATSVTRTAGGVHPVTFHSDNEVLNVLEGGGTQNVNFAHAAIRDLEGRQATSGEKNTIAVALQNGSKTRAQETAAFVNTDQWRIRQVNRIFNGYLRRNLDASGQAYWNGRVAGGTKLRDIRAGVIASPEYFTHQGLGDNSDYVDAVYRDVLGRTPDAAGKAYWLGRLDGGALRSAVASSLLAAPESLNAIIRDSYRQLILKEPAASSLTSWQPKIKNLHDGEQQLQAYLAASSDYFTLAT
ncbi:MAG TPA: DUF4214 domain-containing protein, partial [Acidimicrobiales bacterium]